MRPRSLVLFTCLTVLSLATVTMARETAPPDQDEPLAQAAVLRYLVQTAQPLVQWYQRTPAIERVTGAGLGACALLAMLTLVGRVVRTRTGRIIPAAYRERIHTRILEGRLDWHQAVDFCEMNPSPATRLILAALRRAGRPGPELERGVALALKSEVGDLRRHVGTLRRIACLAPLIGLLGALGQIQRGLATLDAGAAWGPIVASALVPLIASVGLAILSLVSYDGLCGRIETVSAELERLCAEIVDVLATSTRPALAGKSEGHPAQSGQAPHGSFRATTGSPGLTTHSQRTDRPA